MATNPRLFSSLFLAMVSALCLSATAVTAAEREIFYTKTHELNNPRIVPQAEEDISAEGDMVEIVAMYDGWEAAYGIQAHITPGDSVSANGTDPTIPFDRIKLKKATIQAFREYDGILTPAGEAEPLRVYKKGNSLRQMRTTEKLGDIALDKQRLVYRIVLHVPVLWVPCKWHLLRLRLRTPEINKFIELPLLPYYRRCRKCYSYAGLLMAKHGQTLHNCGGRTCQCYDGSLTCEAKCKRRRAYHTLSSSSKQRLVDGMNWLNSEQGNPLGNYLGTANPRSYFSILQDHMTYSGDAHGNSKFLPWHRCYLCEFEQMLQLYDVCLTIPFWYHPIDSTAPPQYHVLDDSYLGDEELPTYGQLNVPWNLPGSFAPFSRGGDNSNAALASSADIATLLSAASFAAYRVPAEGWTHHGMPHVEIGGNMGGYESPADPFFWLHHNMVDRNWNIWRGLSPANAASYDNVIGANVSPQWSIPVSDVIDETGLFAPTATTYTGVGKLPLNDHCAPCYSSVFTIIDAVAIPVPLRFRDEPLEAILAKTLPVDVLQARSSDDYTVSEFYNANKYDYREEQEFYNAVREKCSALKLPKVVKRFGDKFNMNELDLKRELCKRALYRVVPKSITVRSPNRIVNDTEQPCQVDDPESSASSYPLYLEPEVLSRLVPCEPAAEVFSS